MLVRDRMSQRVVTVGPTVSLADALGLMGVHRVRHLPVLEEKELVGVVAQRDITAAVPAPGAFHAADHRHIMDTTPVDSVMALSVVTVAPEAAVDEAASLMTRHQIGCLPVLEQGQLVGIITETDLLRALVELFAGTHGTRIELRLPNRPGELARVVHAIGVDAGANITGIVVPPVTGAEAAAVIQVQSEDVDELLDHLRGLGYSVKAALRGAART